VPPVSFTEDDESKWEAADHAERSIRQLMGRSRTLFETARRFDDAETMNAAGRAMTDFLGSVLWVRRNQPEHGGRMRSPPDDTAIAEREEFSAQVHALLADPTLSPAVLAHVAGAIGVLKYAEYDGVVQARKDRDTLLDVHKAWINLGRVTAAGCGSNLMHYLSNTAISIVQLEDEAGVADAADIIQSMAYEVEIAPDQITERYAGIMADLCGALTYYQALHPQKAYPERSSWEFLKEAPWRGAMLEKVGWWKLTQLTGWTAKMLREQDSAESATVWSWFADRLGREPLHADKEANWRTVGYAFQEALLDRNLAADNASTIFETLQSLADAAGPAALEEFAGGLAVVAFSLPRAEPLSPHDERFVLRVLERDLSSSTDDGLRSLALACLLSHYAFHKQWPLVDDTIARLVDPRSPAGWAGLVAAYRTLAELCHMPDAAGRIETMAAYLSTPYSGAEGAAAVESARRLAIRNLLSRPERDVHPDRFFSLIGVPADE